MRMRFGKHKGQEIHKLPAGYLKWVRNNCNLSGSLLAAIEAGIEGKEYVPDIPKITWQPHEPDMVFGGSPPSGI